MVHLKDSRTVLMFIIAVAVFSADPVSVPAQIRAYESHTTIELVPQFDAVSPAQDFQVGVVFTMDPHWNIYWINPGDSGMPPSFVWSLPDTVAEGDMQWPYPQRVEAPPLTSFGYKGRTVLFQNFSLNKTARSGQDAAFDLDVRWLVCRVECIPGRAQLSLKVPVAEASIINERFREDLSPYFQKVPVPFEDPAGKVFLKDRWVYLTLPSLFQTAADTDIADFFAFQDDVLDHVAVPRFEDSDGTRVLAMKVSNLFQDERAERLQGVLVMERPVPPGAGEAAVESFEIDVPFGREDLPALAGTGGAPGLTLWLAVLFAFTGGIILNLLPCVLPVLSINVLSLIQQAGEDRRKIWRQSWFFALGIVSMFWALMAMLFLFKAAGYQIGWGFQFQQPAVLVFLCALFFGLALYLWGIIRFGSGAVTIRGVPQHQNASVRAFWRGVLMTVCATPCTAPFMGAALGFALTQTFQTAFWVFSAMGLGMALPYILLSRFPSLLRYVPKPGVWMEHVKKFFGFVLLLTVIYLSDILGQQKGVAGVIALYYFLALSALSAWLWQVLKPAGSRRKRGQSIAALLPAAIGLVLMGISLAGPSDLAAVTPYAVQSGIQWQEYSDAAFEEAIRERKDVFINFTAAWCMTCKINDLVAFRDARVIEALNQGSLVSFKADWTHYDAGVTAALERYGRTSIPFYVYHAFSADGQREHVEMLPELITPGIVLRALNRE